MRTVQELVSSIKENARLYYEGEPVISDEEFDVMTDELKSIDPTNPVLSMIGWGYTPTSTDTLVARPHKLDVAKFEKKVRDSSEITIPMARRRPSVKLDGISINLYYVDGLLEYGLTRGDGETGLDITDKLRYVVPNTLSDKSFTGLVRGEGVIRTADFNKYYSDYVSARNLSVGLFKRINVEVKDLLNIRFVAYTVRGTSDVYLNTKDNVFDWLNVNGFELVDELDITNWSDDSLKQTILGYTKYLIDGIIVTDNEYIEMDGTYVPKQEIAYKTTSETATVVVTNVKWSMTRTKKLVPVVGFEPVFLSGAYIHKATAFNARFVSENGLGIGSIVEIHRSGEIIPDIISVSGYGVMNIPTHCEHCGKELTLEGANLFCKNDNCSFGGMQDVQSWMNTLGDVKGLGWSAKSDMIDKLEITHVSDFYKVVDAEIIQASFGSATTELFKEMFNRLRSPVSFQSFLVACNIDGLGWNTANKLEPLKQALLESDSSSLCLILQSAKGVNKRVVDGIIKKLDYIRECAKLVTFSTDEPEVVEVDPNKGVTITGSLSMKRSEFVDLIKAKGWSEVDIKKAKYLITNKPDSGSSKNKKARELGVHIITEEEFLVLIQ